MRALGSWPESGAYSWSESAELWITMAVGYFIVDLTLCLWYPQIFGFKMIAHATAALGGYSLILVRHKYPSVYNPVSDNFACVRGPVAWRIMGWHFYCGKHRLHLLISIMLSKLWNGKTLGQSLEWYCYRNLCRLFRFFGLVTGFGYVVFTAVRLVLGVSTTWSCFVFASDPDNQVPEILTLYFKLAIPVMCFLNITWWSTATNSLVEKFLS